MASNTAPAWDRAAVQRILDAGAVDKAWPEDDAYQKIQEGLLISLTWAR